MSSSWSSALLLLKALFIVICIAMCSSGSDVDDELTHLGQIDPDTHDLVPRPDLNDNVPEQDFSISPMNEDIDYVAHVTGIRLKEPLCAHDVARLRDALAKYGVLLFHDQDLDALEQIRFTLNFGRVEWLGPDRDGIEGNAPSQPSNYVFRVANDKKHGYTDTGLYFHNDGSMRSRLSMNSIWHVKEVPKEAGETLFTDNCGVLEILIPEEVEYLSSLYTMHANGDVGPLVRPHGFIPDRKCLYWNLAGPTIGFIANVTFDEHGTAQLDPDAIVHPQEAEALVKQLNHLLQTETLLYKHKWEEGDVVMIENHGIAHAGTPSPKDKTGLRVLHRTTVAGSYDTGLIKSDFRPARGSDELDEKETEAMRNPYIH